MPDLEVVTGRQNADTSIAFGLGPTGRLPAVFRCGLEKEAAVVGQTCQPVSSEGGRVAAIPTDNQGMHTGSLLTRGLPGAGLIDFGPELLTAYAVAGPGSPR